MDYTTSKQNSHRIVTKKNDTVELLTWICLYSKLLKPQIFLSPLKIPTEEVATLTY